MTDQASSNRADAAQPPLVIATRASPLAMAQAHEVRDRLIDQAGYDPEALRLEPIVSRGDKILDRPLTMVGGKGLFTQEIEDGLSEGRYDLAVHSLKDLPTRLPDGLMIAAYPPRSDPRDVLISKEGGDITALPRGARVGTASIRRAAQLRQLQPDLDIVSVRGNVQTRLSRLDDGTVDALILAAAGLKRLDLAIDGACPLPVDQMLPAPGQGCLAIECRAGDDALLSVLAHLNCAEAAAAVTAERAFLEAVDGDCRTPVAAHAALGEDGQLHLAAQILHPAGSQVFAAQTVGAPTDAAALGQALGAQLRAEAGEDVLAAIKSVADGQ